MKKHHISLFIFALTCTISAQANTWYFQGKTGVSFAQINQIKADSITGFGTSTPYSGDFRDNTLMFGGSVGYEYTDWDFPLRGEAEYMYRGEYSYDADPALLNQAATQIKSHLKNQTFLANGYIDFPIAKPLTIYLGGGLGVAKNSTDGTYTFTTTSKHSASNTSFSWMTTIGLSATLTQLITFDMSYRYSGLGDNTWKVNAAGDKFKSENYYANEILFTFRLTPFLDTQS